MWGRQVLWFPTLYFNNVVKGFKKKEKLIQTNLKQGRKKKSEKKEKRYKVVSIFTAVKYNYKLIFYYLLFYYNFL